MEGDKGESKCESPQQRTPLLQGRCSGSVLLVIPNPTEASRLLQKRPESQPLSDGGEGLSVNERPSLDQLSAGRTTQVEGETDR